MITYDCPELCAYTQEAWEPHCEYTGRDNYQGQCGNVDFGGIRQMRYPCPNHRGLNNPAISRALVGQDGSHMWQNAPLECGDYRERNVELPQGRLRRRWEENEDLYEKDLTMPQDLMDMTRGQWMEYYNDLFASHADTTWGRMYEWDPQPWGEAREGGALP